MLLLSYPLLSFLYLGQRAVLSSSVYAGAAVTSVIQGGALMTQRRGSFAEHFGCCWMVEFEDPLLELTVTERQQQAVDPTEASAGRRSLTDQHGKVGGRG